MTHRQLDYAPSGLMTPRASQDASGAGTIHHVNDCGRVEKKRQEELLHLSQRIPLPPPLASGLRRRSRTGGSYVLEGKIMFLGGRPSLGSWVQVPINHLTTIAAQAKTKGNPGARSSKVVRRVSARHLRFLGVHLKHVPDLSIFEGLPCAARG